MVGLIGKLDWCAVEIGASCQVLLVLGNDSMIVVVIVVLLLLLSLVLSGECIWGSTSASIKPCGVYTADRKTRGKHTNRTMTK